MRKLIVVFFGALSLTAQAAQALDECRDFEFGKVLAQLSQYGEVHNCIVDIEQYEAEGKSHFLVYAKDYVRCDLGMKCPQAHLSMVLPTRCLRRSTENPRDVRFVTEINTTGVQRRLYSQVRRNHLGQVMLFKIGLSSGSGQPPIFEVRCEPDSLGVGQ